MPDLKTPRLRLRPFAPSDARAVQRLAGAPEVALMTLNIPHPYEDGIAEAWIAGHEEHWRARACLTLAVTAAPEGLVGSIALRLAPRHRRGELGYWIGAPFWNRGYATEAAAAVVEFGFRELNLNRIQARHLTRNPASGRVMQKIGMTQEGVLRQQAYSRGRFEDLAMYAILRSDAPSGRGWGSGRTG